MVIFIWVPAGLAWLIVIVNPQVLDMRSEEELQEEELNAIRLDSYYGVHTIASDAEYTRQSMLKEDALAQIVRKVGTSERLLSVLAQANPQGDWEQPRVDRGDVAPWAKNKEVAERLVEVSYVMPPPPPMADNVGTAQSLEEEASLALQRWCPSLVVSHRSGSVAFVSLEFKYLSAVDDREDKWACTKALSYLIAPRGAEGLSDDVIFEVTAPLPHGIRYMRI